MPGFVVANKAAGVKWIGGYADNVRHGLPYIMGAILLSDPQSGAVLAVMDGSHITNLRTGAAAMVSAKYLACPNAATLAVIGAGTQGTAILKAMSLQFPKLRVRVADISARQRREFCETMRAETGMDVSEAETVESAVSGADIIATVTTSKVPIVKDSWIKRGALVLAMSSYPQMEDKFLFAADAIIVDSVEQASHRGEIKHLVESGRLGKERIVAELGEVVVGAKRGRQTDQQRIVMIPTGLGAQDICVAQHVYQLAVERKMGVWVDLNS
jgi:ornithine cyclodeaminase/alanine dehydrogenase-like protein (mu-crystallin family)